MYDNLIMDPILVALRDGIIIMEAIRDSELGVWAGAKDTFTDCLDCPLLEMEISCSNSACLEYSHLVKKLLPGGPSEVVLQYTPQFFQNRVRPVIKQIIKDLKEAEQQFLLRESERNQCGA